MRWCRRQVLRLGAAVAVLAGVRAGAQTLDEADRGLGGTGVVPMGGDEDRGIGGTGVIGTIRRFGSIEVNDLRITFARTVPVRIDGRAARLRDLKLGHVVQVLARARAGRLETGFIAVASEVVGPIDAVTPDGFIVLGQEVVVAAGIPGRRWIRGMRVAVSGLRRLDGTIVASLIERRSAGRDGLAGVARAAADDGVVRIGALALAGLDPGLVGHRIHATGRRIESVLHVDRASVDAGDLLASKPADLSIEAYVATVDAGLQLGSGLSVEGGAALTGTVDEVKAVVSAAVEPDGRLRVESLRINAGGRGSPSGSQMQGHRPGDFGRPPGGPPGAHGGPPGGVGHPNGGPGFGPSGGPPGGGPTRSGGGAFGPGGASFGPGGGSFGPGGPGGPGAHPP